MVKIQLKLKTIEGNDSSITIDDEKTIGEFRDCLQSIVQITPENQRLIFRGRVLNENSRKIKEYGLEDGMAIHIVSKPLPPVIAAVGGDPNAQNQASQTASQEHDPHIITQNLIIGQIPFERTSLFHEPNQTMIIVGNVIEQLRNRYRMEAEHTLRLDQPQNNDFLINVTFRGSRNQIVSSPARERFDSLRLALKKLAWMTALIQSQFIEGIDAVLGGELQDQSRAYHNIAHILRMMHDFDHFLEQHFSNYVIDPELSALIEQLNEWDLPNDDGHVEQLNQFITMRHCTSSDFSTLLMMLTVVDAKINEHLLSRYHRILALPHNFQSNSYPARLLNCFTSAISRLQHHRAHLYHNISDLSLHFDNNEPNRLFPQYAAYRRVEEPPQAQISLMFFNPHNMNLSTYGQLPRQQPANQQHAQQAQRSATRTIIESMVNGIRGLTQARVVGNSNQNSSTSTQHGTPNSTSQPQTFQTSAEIPRVTRTPSLIPVQSLPSILHERRNLVPNERSTRQRNQPTEFYWRRVSPEAQHAMFVGPSPPAQLPLFTMDPFLTCSSRRYRVFEVDARHNDFWNDPETIALQIDPPQNSIAASFRNLPQGQFPQMDIDVRTASDIAGRGSRNMIPDDEIPSIINENLSVYAQANNHGEAVFTEIEHFTQFVRQTLETIANCMVYYDETILPHHPAIQRGFTASSRVGGFVPYMMSPFIPVPGSGFFPQGTEQTPQALITMTFEPREFGQQPPSSGNSQFGSSNNGQ